MKIFKELNKLGYKHYTEHTVEELDDLPLDSEERIMEQALVLRWFREKYSLDHEIPYAGKPKEYHAFVKDYVYGNNRNNPSVFSYEEAELACLIKLIEICKEKKS